MADKYLIVVDMQNDFVSGSLGTKEAKEIVGNVLKRVSEFDGKICFTMDTHGDDYLNTQEGRRLPIKHCIKGTSGWELIKELRDIQGDYPIYEKGTFGSIKLAEDLKREYDKGKVKSIEFIGLCTDICVTANAIVCKTYMPELDIYVNSACCAGVTPESHSAALKTMASCQIEIL